MTAHQFARLVGCASLDRLDDRLMFPLDLVHVTAKRIGVLKGPHALPGNDQSAEKMQEFDEAAVLRRGCDRIMKGKVLVDAPLAARRNFAEHFLRLPDCLELERRRALGRKRRS